MLSFTGSLKIFIALDPIDMRAGVNTLSALVAGRLQETAQSGALFVLPSSLDSSSMAVSLRPAHPQTPLPHQGALLGWHAAAATHELLM